MKSHAFLILLILLSIALAPVGGVQADASVEYDPLTKQAFDAILAGNLEQLRSCIDDGLDLYASNLIGMSLAEVCIGLEDLDALELLLKAGYDANHQDRYGNYLVDEGIVNQNLELIQLLLDYGADPSLPDQLGSTAMNTAASYCVPAVLAVLLQNTELVHVTGIGGKSLLHNAVSPYDFSDDARPEEAIGLLLSSGLDVDIRDDAGQTPLFMAVNTLGQEKHPELVKFLLEHGADPNARDNRNETPLLYGSYDIDNEVIEMLLEAGADINARDKIGRTIMHDAAIFCSDVQRFKLLCEQGAKLDLRDNWGYTPLHLALIRPNPDGETALLGLGADYDLAAAAAKGDLVKATELTAAGVIDDDSQLAALACTLAAKTNHRDVLDLLVDNGAKPAPIAAVYLGDDELLKELLDQGADANRRYRRNATALHVAAAKNDTAAIGLLCDYGAELDALDDRHQTPLVTAVRDRDLAATKLLLALGADPDIPGIMSTPPLTYAISAKTTDFCKALLEAGADVMFADSMGATPLHRAAASSSLSEEMIDLLVSHGADPNARDKNGGTPLASACAIGISPGAITALVEHGADPEIANNLGFTPLAWAVTMGKVDTVKTLLDLGASPNLKFFWGGTPLWWAKEQGNSAMVELLEQHGAHDPPPEVLAEMERYKALFWPDEE